jgi:hypothetical protein
MPEACRQSGNCPGCGYLLTDECVKYSDPFSPQIDAGKQSGFGLNYEPFPVAMLNLAHKRM